MDVKVGDQVLTKEGTFKSVTVIHKNKYTGKLVKNFVSGSLDPIISTPNHEYFSVRNSRCDGYHYCSFKKNKCRTCNTQEFDITTVRADSLTKKDLHLTPTLELIDNYPVFKDQYQDKKFGVIAKKIDELLNDPEFLDIVGLYIAEGCCKSREVIFSFHSNEIDLHNKVIQFFSKYDITATKRKMKHGACSTINVSNSRMAKWFKDNCGQRAENKKIPNEAMISKHVNRVIKFYLKGDGHDNKRNVNQSATVSRELSYQLCLLLCSLGIKFSTYTEAAKVYQGMKKQKVYHIYINYLGGSSSQINNDGNLFKTNKKSEIIDVVDFYIYNLTVEDSHTYTANGVAVKNCGGLGRIQQNSTKTIKCIEDDRKDFQFIDGKPARINTGVRTLTGKYDDIKVGEDFDDNLLNTALKVVIDGFDYSVKQVRPVKLLSTFSFEAEVERLDRTGLPSDNVLSS